MLFRSNSDGLSTPVWVRARIRCFEKAWMAVRPLAFGEQLDPSFFKLGRTETTNLREVPFSGSLEDLQQVLKGSRLKRSLSANAALLPGMLDRKPDAAPGSSLRVEFISESGIRVSAEGLLMSPGIIGGDVKARLKSSKKLVTGKLVSQGLVEVAL